MKIDIIKDGSSVGEVDTETGAMSGSVPDTVKGALTAQTTVHIGGENEVEERWTDPTREEIIDRIVAASQGSDFGVEIGNGGSESLENPAQDSPFSSVPVLPTDLEKLTKPWLVRWAEWIKAGRPAITGPSALRSWNPALHPRDPRTGKFVERSFNIPDGVDVSGLGDMSSGELLQEIDAGGGDIESVLQDDSISIDGVSDEANTLDEVGDSGRDITSEVDEILANSENPHSELEDYVESVGDLDGIVQLPVLDEGEDRRELVETLARAFDNGMAGPTTDIRNARGDKHGVYAFNNETLGFSRDVSSDVLDGLEDEGSTVGDTIEWLALHELGHANHHTEMGDVSEVDDYLFEGSLASSRDGEFIGRERLELAENEVSEYGRTSPIEFVAEVFAGKALGREYPDEVMEMYEEFDGPDNWSDYQ